MKEIFIGFAFGDDRAQKLLGWNKNGLQTAANQYQLGFLEGLDRDVEIISATAVGTFPRRNKKLFYERETEHSSAGDIEHLPFVNLHFFRSVMFERGVYKRLKQVLTETDEAVTVYVYSLYIPFLKALKKLKKKFSDRLYYCLIVPDLPGKYGIMRKKYSLAGIKDRIDVKKKFELAAYADRYVFLTEPMKDLFPTRPYTVIEGFLPQCEFDYTNIREPKTLLYTGSLNAAFGIGTLLEAFGKISDPEYRLWICGAGDAKEQIEAAAKEDSRISYMGYLPKAEVAALQTRCDVLINPRPNTDLFTQYSFPSKTMEYLMSGSKVLMYRLSGIPDEYYDFIFEMKEDGADGMKEAILNACGDAVFYEARYMDQIRWIAENKCAKKQMISFSEK